MHSPPIVGPWRNQSDSATREIRTSGLMSGDGKRSAATAPVLDAPWAAGFGWRAWAKFLVWRKVWVLRPSLMPDRNCHARHARRYAAWVLLASHRRQEGHCRL